MMDVKGFYTILFLFVSPTEDYAVTSFVLAGPIAVPIRVDVRNDFNGNFFLDCHSGLKHLILPHAV